MRPKQLIANTLKVCPVLLALLFSSCKSDSDQTEAKPLTIKTETAYIYSGQDKGDYQFISKPFRTSELSFRVGGPIDRLEVYPGNHYKRGDIIAEIDSRDFRIRKERASAVCEQLKAEYERISVLYEKGNMSASTFEKAKADYISAKAAYDECLNALEDSRLTAPFDGYVGEVFIEKFQDVKPSQPVLTLIDISRLKIEIYVTQEVAIAARNASSVEIVFDALPGRMFTAKIVEVSKGTSRNNLSYIITALLQNENGELLSGMSGKAHLVIDINGESAENGVAIPMQALCHRPGIGDFVWVVDKNNSTVKMRRVSGAELKADGVALIKEGLEEGEIVATTGLRFLSDGMNVNLNR